MDCNTPGFPVHHQLLELAQTHVHWVGDANNLILCLPLLLLGQERSLVTKQTLPVSLVLTSAQFSSVTQSCPTLCDPVDCSLPAFPVLHHLLELAQTHVHWVSDAILSLCHPLVLLPSVFPSIRVFSDGHLFTSDGRNIGASVLLMNIQDWFPLGLTGLISLQSKWF